MPRCFLRFIYNCIRPSRTQWPKTDVEGCPRAKNVLSSLDLTREHARTCVWCNPLQSETTSVRASQPALRGRTCDRETHTTAPFCPIKHYKDINVNMYPNHFYWKMSLILCNIFSFNACAFSWHTYYVEKNQFIVLIVENTKFPTDVFIPTTWHSVVVKLSIVQTCFISLSCSLGDISLPATHRTTVRGHDCAVGPEGHCSVLSAPDASLNGPLLVQRQFLSCWHLWIFCWDWTDVCFCEPTAGGNAFPLPVRQAHGRAATRDSMFQWNDCERALNVAPVGGLLPLDGWSPVLLQSWPLRIDLLAQNMNWSPSHFDTRGGGGVNFNSVHTLP